MKKMIVLSAVCLSAAVLLAQTQTDNKAKEAPPTANAKLALIPLNVKTGLWQITETVAWTGLPPQLAGAMDGRATKYESCVKAKNLSSNPWAEGSGDKCTWTALNSNGTDMGVQGKSCQFGKEYGMTADVEGKIHVIDSQDGTGSFDITLTGNGQTMKGHATYTGKWIGASCPTGTN